MTDPSTRLDLVDALAIRREPLFTMLDRLIFAGCSSKYVFIFADCGMGKTTFLINYFHRRRNKLGRKKLSIALVSLSKSGYLDEIKAIPLDRHAETILLMDAFDEDPLVFEGVTKRLDVIIGITSSFRSVVISCRSQFFASDKDIPVATGALRVGPTPLGFSKEYEFSKIYIAPFDVKRVRKYLRTAFPGAKNMARRGRAKAMIARVPSLVMRPMLLAHISDVLENENRENLMSQADIYQAIVSAWVRRESRWVKGGPLLDFSKKLALDIYENRHVRGGEYCSRDELAILAEQWKIPIRKEFLTGRSLLNRTDDGWCKFAHRSIMEYLVSSAVLEGYGKASIDLNSQIALFIFDRLGVNPSFPDGRLDQGASLMLSSPESRLGYPTNFGIYYENPEALDASLLYGMEVQDETGGFGKFGDHLQYMMEHLDERQKLLDVRISVAPNAGGMLIAYISVWGSSAAALSRVRVPVKNWARIFGARWLGRELLNVVGRPTYRGDSASDLSFHAATLCDFPVDMLGVEAADSCQVLSAGVRYPDERMVLKLIPGFGVASSLLPFGVLRGGSISFLDGKRTRLLYRREQDARPSLSADGSVVQEIPLVSTAEKWFSGRNN